MSFTTIRDSEHARSLAGCWFRPIGMGRFHQANKQGQSRCLKFSLDNGTRVDVVPTVEAAVSRCDRCLIIAGMRPVENPDA